MITIAEVIPMRMSACPLSTHSGRVRFRPIADIGGMAEAPTMTLSPLWEGSELLHKLVADYLSDRIDTETFCSNFEQAFNFDVDRTALTPSESDAFQRLFDEAVYFSPFPEERAAFSSYRSEDQIREAARAAEAQLSAKG